MTQTTRPTKPRPDDAPTGSNTPRHPSDILMNLIVAFLAPMFISVSGGDINYARMAAIETVNAYRSRNHADLIAIAQIVAFGLAALGSLSLSMADDISLSMTLRLRGNANALNHSAEQNRRALVASRATGPIPHHAEPTGEAETRAPLANDDVNGTEPAAGMAPAKNPNAQSNPRTGQAPAGPALDPAPAPTTAQTAARMAAGKRHQAIWATAMVKEGAKLTASIPHLPQAERRAASIRAAVLSSTADELLTGANSPSALPAPNTV
jgi:hypothetical protein